MCQDMKYNVGISIHSLYLVPIPSLNMEVPITSLQHHISWRPRTPNLIWENSLSRTTACEKAYTLIFSVLIAPQNLTRRHIYPYLTWYPWHHNSTSEGTIYSHTQAQGHIHPHHYSSVMLQISLQLKLNSSMRTHTPSPQLKLNSRITPSPQLRINSSMRAHTPPHHNLNSIQV